MKRKDAKTQSRDENELSNLVIGAAIAVHRELGPGLLESVYEECLLFELQQEGCRCERQPRIPVVYKGHQLSLSSRPDMIVEGILVIELKATEKPVKVHAVQLLTYLKLTGCKLGLVLNFGMPTLTNGIERVVNGLPEL